MGNSLCRFKSHISLLRVFAKCCFPLLRKINFGLLCEIILRDSCKMSLHTDVVPEWAFFWSSLFSFKLIWFRLWSSQTYIIKNISSRVEREPQAEHPLKKKLTMNATESKAESFDDTCPMNKRFGRRNTRWKKLPLPRQQYSWTS